MEDFLQEGQFLSRRFSYVCIMCTIGVWPTEALFHDLGKPSSYRDAFHLEDAKWAGADQFLSICFFCISQDLGNYSGADRW